MLEMHNRTRDEHDELADPGRHPVGALRAAVIEPAFSAHLASTPLKQTMPCLSMCIARRAAHLCITTSGLLSGTHTRQGYVGLE